MKYEIKEILAYFEKYIKITDMHDSEPMLDWKDLKIVLDYITNLQEENEKLNDIIETLKETNNLLINQKYKLEYELDMLDNKRDKAINVLKLCNSKCAKETINILQGCDNNDRIKTM